jgi:SAM-dependent methyltransferase
MNHPCILCGSTDTSTRKIGDATIRRALLEYFDEPLPTGVALLDYDMLECQQCKLVSALPMIPGDETFYKWVTSHPNYYPSVRWEWRTVVERIARASASRRISILDVGCGSGDFLAQIKSIPGVDPWGVDTTMTSVERARGRGLNAVCADLDRFLSLNPSRRFDFVTSFHCVEHVENPISFMEGIKRLLKPNGGVGFVSAPLSPMSIEYGWFDPLNHPPHHLSRWSRPALEKLAEITGFQISITTSPAGSSISRALRALALAKRGVLHSGGRVQKIILAVRNLPEFYEACKMQRRREKIDGKTAGDTFLAAFTLHS